MNLNPYAIKSRIFISYSRRDAKWLERLRTHLKPLELDYGIDIWDDTLIAPGAKWHDLISQAIHSARVGILLISADFLASDFIRQNELPPLLTAAETAGATILPVILSPCLYEETKELSQFQSINSPSQPLSKMSRNNRELTFMKIAKTVSKMLFEKDKQENLLSSNLIKEKSLLITATLHPFNLMSGKSSSFRQLTSIHTTIEKIDEAASAIVGELAILTNAIPTDKIKLIIHNNLLDASYKLEGSVALLNQLAGQGYRHLDVGEFGNGTKLNLNELPFLQLRIGDPKGRFNSDSIVIYKHGETYSFNPKSLVKTRVFKPKFKKTAFLIQPFEIINSKVKIPETLKVTFDHALRSAIQKSEWLEVTGLTERELKEVRKDLGKMPVDYHGKGPMINRYDVDFFISGSISSVV